MSILNEAAEQLKVIEKNIKTIKAMLKSAPDGVLQLESRRNTTEYYHVRKRENKEERIYIPRSKHSLAERLAQKSYNEKCLKVLEEEQNVLQKLIRNYKPAKKYEIYEKLHPLRKELVKPLKSAAELRYEEWLAEPCPAYDAYVNYQLYQTDRGEMVRSKSEVIIANYLNSQEDILDYRYEKGLWMKSAGARFHPDFTIFLKNSGRIIYHEHFGMMDDSEYANEFTVKYEHYIRSGFIPGRDFFFTCESSSRPFSIQSFKTIIREIAG